MIRDRGRRVLELEATAILRIAKELDSEFDEIVRHVADTKGKIILCGVGKSGIICKKIAATLSSTGTPAVFMHPTEAAHGDLGMITHGDTVIAVSNSGETEELIHLIKFIKRGGAQLIVITGNLKSSLAKYADLKLAYSVEEEGCPLGLAPMASTTTILAIGDAIAAAVMESRGFTQKEFARFHPGGKLGSKLVLISELIDKKPKLIPMVSPDTPLTETLLEMSEKMQGMTAVDLGNGSLGVITDGDIRRLLQKHGSDALLLTAGKVCSRTPKTVNDNQLAVEALQMMEEYKLTNLIVMDAAGREYRGVLHLHDLWRIQMI